MVHLDRFCYCISLRMGSYIITAVNMLVYLVFIYATKGKQAEFRMPSFSSKLHCFDGKHN